MFYTTGMAQEIKHSEGEEPHQLDVRYTIRSDHRMASIRPLPKGRGRIVVSQGRMYDARQMGGHGDWGQPMIEWERVLVATGDEADAMAEALREAARLYREWETQR